MSNHDLALPPLDYSPMDGMDDTDGDLSDWEALDLVPSMPELKEAGIVAGAGALALIGITFVAPKVLPSGWSSTMKNIATFLAAVVAAKFASRYSRSGAIGILGAVGGLAAANVIGALTGRTISLGDFGASPEEKLLSSFMGEGDDMLSNLPEERALMAGDDEGMGRTDVETEPRFGDFGVVSIEKTNPLGSWIGGY